MEADATEQNTIYQNNIYSLKRKYLQHNDNDYDNDYEVKRQDLQFDVSEYSSYYSDQDIISSVLCSKQAIENNDSLVQCIICKKNIFDNTGQIKHICLDRYFV
jgi:predicted metal-dependent phosphotriesterase family hydrolase